MKVKLNFTQRKTGGHRSNSVEISAGLKEIGVDQPGNVEITDTHIIETDSSPRQVLEQLEEIVVKEIEEKPTMRDALQGRPKDNDEKHKDYPRFFGYFGTGVGPRQGHALEDAKTRDKKRNERIRHIFDSFIEKISGTPLS